MKWPDSDSVHWPVDRDDPSSSCWLFLCSGGARLWRETEDGATGQGLAVHAGELAVDSKVPAEQLLQLRQFVVDADLLLRLLCEHLLRIRRRGRRMPHRLGGPCANTTVLTDGVKTCELATGEI